MSERAMLNALSFIAGSAGFAVLWWNAGGWVALGVCLVLWGYGMQQAARTAPQ